jgi:hypothetical protein
MRLLAAALAMLASACATVPPVDGPLPIVPEARVRLAALPAWGQPPVVGTVVAATGDTLRVRRADSAAVVVAVPVACLAAAEVWQSGSRVGGAMRGFLLGAVGGTAAGLAVTPEPSLWTTPTAVLAAPTIAAGTVLGTALGWTRPGGAWRAGAIPGAGAEPIRSDSGSPTVQTVAHVTMPTDSASRTCRPPAKPAPKKRAPARKT